MFASKLGLNFTRAPVTLNAHRLLALRSISIVSYCPGLNSSQGSSKRSMSAAAAGASSPGPVMPDVFMETSDPDITFFQQHQDTAARPSPADQARTLVGASRIGVLGTFSVLPETKGFPSANVIEFAIDAQGMPLFATSSLSGHTRDLLADGRCSLSVMAPGFKSLQDARLSLTGTAVEITDPAAQEAARKDFLAQLPNAFYVTFQDFKFFRMAVSNCRYNFGFGAAGKISVNDYMSSRPDPVAPFSAPVGKHMNDDHEQDMIDMVRHYTKLKVEGAKIIDLDRLGLNMTATRNGATFKLRLPFPRPAEDRKSIKDVIVEMTKAARGQA